MNVKTFDTDQGGFIYDKSGEGLAVSVKILFLSAVIRVKDFLSDAALKSFHCSPQA